VSDEEYAISNARVRAEWTEAHSWLTSMGVPTHGAGGALLPLDQRISKLIAVAQARGGRV
jgi:hypothetical protein